MLDLSTMMRFAVVLIAVVLPASLLADKPRHKGDKVQFSDPKLYVGAETCKTCHQAEAASYNHGPHWKTETSKHSGPQWQGCEGCHGPGKAHVDASGDATKIFRFDPSTVNAKQSSERCLSCHEKDASHENFLRSPHLKNGVACTTCHSIHASKVQHDLLVAAPPALCYSCHQSVAPDFSKPAHHRVNEGLMSCTDCHNPHGSALPHNLRASSSQSAICTTCHVDTAGPFVFEHAPLKEMGCVSCHSPHGSANPHMLNRPQVNQLCLECHSTVLANSIAPGAPTFHNQGTKYQQCVLCHVAIHGSNTSAVFFRR